MAAPQNAPLPPFFTLNEGMIVRITAIDATTGAVVSGVKVSNASVDVDNFAPDEPTPDQPKGPIFLIPGPVV